MSYILDALKKLEHEKARKERVGGMATIAGELLRDDVRRDTGSGIWKIALMAIVVAVLTFGVAWLVFKGDKRSTTSVVQPTLPPVAAVQAVPATTPVPVPTQSAPMVPPQSTQSVQSAVQEEQGAGKPASARGRREHGRDERGSSLPAVTPSQAAVQVVAAPADIKVSGIAWQEERTARRAVVNGFLIREGSDVAGARIIEIYPGRIRFSQSGRTFVVPLISSAMPNGAK